jgi:hypothetical protein
MDNYKKEIIEFDYFIEKNFKKQFFLVIMKRKKIFYNHKMKFPF